MHPLHRRSSNKPANNAVARTEVSGSSSPAVNARRCTRRSGYCCRITEIRYVRFAEPLTAALGRPVPKGLLVNLRERHINVEEERQRADEAPSRIPFADPVRPWQPHLSPSVLIDGIAFHLRLHAPHTGAVCLLEAPSLVPPDVPGHEAVARWTGPPGNARPLPGPPAPQTHTINHRLDPGLPSESWQGRGTERL